MTNTTTPALNTVPCTRVLFVDGGLALHFNFGGGIVIALNRHGLSWDGAQIVGAARSNDQVRIIRETWETIVSAERADRAAAEAIADQAMIRQIEAREARRAYQEAA